MTSETTNPPPVLVLGLGNILLADDGVGVTLLERLRPEGRDVAGVEFLDGGTQGLALVPWVAGRRALLILDAVARGAKPGTIHVIRDPVELRQSGGRTAHESNAGSLIAALDLLGDLPPEVVVVGIEPAELKTRIGLSEAVEAAVPAATLRALRLLARLRSRAKREVAACMS